MNQKSIVEIGEQFGLTVEAVNMPERETVYKICKGVNQVFVGTEAPARDFLAAYETERPALFEGSMYGYME